MDTHARLQQLLRERGWTEYKLSKECGLAQSTIGNIFRRNTIPSIATLGRIWKPSKRPNSGPFSAVLPHFSLQYTKYSCGKMTCTSKKSLAVGHIAGFQIRPRNDMCRIWHHIVPILCRRRYGRVKSGNERAVWLLALPHPESKICRDSNAQGYESR